MHSLRQLVGSVTGQLYINVGLKSLLAGGSAALLLTLLAGGIWPAVLLGTLVSVLIYRQLGGFTAQQPVAVSLLHQRLGDTEYSLPLLAKETPNLAEQLQLERLADRAAQLPRPLIVFQNLWPYALALALSGGIVGLVRGWPAPPAAAADPTRPVAQPTKPPADPLTPPAFQSAQLTVQPPAYTDLPVRTSAGLNVSAYAGSGLTWQVQLTQTQRVAVRMVNSRGEEIPFTRQQNGFRHQDRLLNSGLYALRAYWKTPANRDSLIYQSEFYRLEARPDLPPAIKPALKELYTFHRMGQPMQRRVSAQISDDFRVQQAFIVATLARGSGENVKFRESRFPVASGFKATSASYVLDLAKLGFAPGDELYYYWAAIDNRQPEPQLTKSDTYFIVFKDTARTADAELATMAVNIMPEYFRSQRQIIIDTDKLIAKRKKITPKTFNSESNEIGFDQKVLRLRYGQYMGEEFENQIGGHTPLADNDADLLAGYEHRHDTQQDPNGGETSPAAKAPGHDDHDDDHDHEKGHGNAHDGHDHGGKAGQEQDPLAAMMEQYVHNHDNGEVNTFYEQSTRSLLKMSLEQMWQAELYLRLYEPEKARPFEQKALEYLKIAQQKARAYAKKSGYDPPPLKEKETRLTGELGKISTQHRATRQYADVPVATLAARVLGLLELPRLTAAQRQTVGQLSAALSGPLLRSGLPNWSVLTGLQQLASGQSLSPKTKADLLTRLTPFAAGSRVGNRPATVADRRLESAFWRAMR